jgi:hypothetical protein
MVRLQWPVPPLSRHKQRQFAFSALTYYAERPSDKTALITFFPIGDAMRANLFVYREFDDPWLRQMRSEAFRRHAVSSALFSMVKTERLLATPPHKLSRRRCWLNLYR